MSVRAAGIPKPVPIPASPYVPELISLSEVLPMMGIAFWCVWAAYTTTESPKAAAPTMVSSEVAADAAEPSEVVALAVMFPEVMAPAAISPEVVAQAAEPPEAAVLASVPCVVVAPSNALTACHVATGGTVADLSLFPDGTAVEPPEVAASAAEPPEVSVVSVCESLSCPVTAMEAVCDSSFCPVMAMEAVCDSSSYPVMATEAALEHLSCSEPAEKAISELSPHSETAMVSDFELSVLPVSVKESKPELLVSNLETINTPHICPVNPVSAKEIINEPEGELSACPVLVKEHDFELSSCPILGNESVC